MLHFADYQSKLNKSNKKDHLIIYGAGTLGKVTLQTLKKHNIDVDFFCDSDVRKHHLKVEEKDIISIASTVYLKKKSHLSIVVGKNGSMLVKISKMARINSENFFKKKVYLKIFIKYDPKWKNTNSILDSYS